MMMMDRAAAAAAMRSRKTGAVITVDTRVLNDGARSDNQNVDKTTLSQDLRTNQNIVHFSLRLRRRGAMAPTHHPIFLEHAPAQWPNAIYLANG